MIYVYRMYFNGEMLIKKFPHKYVLKQVCTTYESQFGYRKFFDGG